jgi:hypothetical protein
VGTPGRLHTLLTVESVTVHALNPVTSAADLAQRSREGLPRMTQRHEQPVANGQLNVNNADSALSRILGVSVTHGTHISHSGA